MIDKKFYESLKQGSVSPFEEPFELMKRIYEIKDRMYGSSWRKRGLISAFENVARKYDRLLTILEEHGFTPKNLNETEQMVVFDTVFDLAVYSYLLLWFVYDLFGKDLVEKWEDKIL